MQAINISMDVAAPGSNDYTAVVFSCFKNEELFLESFSIKDTNDIENLWKLAAKIREIAVPDPVNLLKPWMPIAMVLQAVDTDKLYKAILNFIDVYNRLKEGQGAKEDSERAASGDEDGAQEGDSEGQLTKGE